MHYFDRDPHSALDAKILAQRMAFAPISFQAARLLRNFGLLDELWNARATGGLSLVDLQARSGLPLYGVKVLLEAGLGLGLVYLKQDGDLAQAGCRDDVYLPTKLGYIVAQDPMTRVNMDFCHDVCYRGMFDLEAAILRGAPQGLAAFGSWKTVYEALPALPPEVRRSWLNFDHYYSDEAFPPALARVFERRPRRILDVGGNTGKWARLCVQHDADVQVTILDLPGQLEWAQQALAVEHASARVASLPFDLLDPALPFPVGHDVIWMSQVLDCFSVEQMEHILRRAAVAMTPQSSLFILETYWDRQDSPAAAFCMQQTSLYFTAIANGNSQIYHSRDIRGCVERAGLVVRDDWDRVGAYHTLFRCELAP